MKVWAMETWARLAQARAARPGVVAEPGLLLDGSGALDGLRDLGRWDELAATVAQEGQGRVVMAGLPGAGKRLLLNRLRGWDLASLWQAGAEQFEGMAVESYGSFVLADLTQPPEGRPFGGDELLLLLGDPALVVYVVDAGRGVLAGHYLAQTVAKLVPVVGWAVAGVLAAVSTLLVGEAAIAYYAAGGATPLRSWLRRPGRLGSVWRRGGAEDTEAVVDAEASVGAPGAAAEEGV